MGTSILPQGCLSEQWAKTVRRASSSGHLQYFLRLSAARLDHNR